MAGSLSGHRALKVAGLALGLALLGWGSAGCGPRSDELPPNLLLISIDTLRADHLGAYGRERNPSPNIDALARDGLLFERAYSQSPKTAPSHMSILTGVVPDVHGVENWENELPNRRLSDEIPTLATLLSEVGYHTAAFTGGGHVVAKLGFDQGFQEFREDTDIRTAFGRAAATMEGLSKQPFFVFVHTYEVHDPYAPPKKYQEMYVDPRYAGEIISLPSELMARSRDWQARVQTFWRSVDRKSAADLHRLRDLYDAGIRYADRFVGELLKRLEETGAADRTIVILLSDHGEEFMEHGHFRHRNIYQELLHVPLIVRIPGQEGEAFRGRRIDGLVRLIDILPTILGLMDLPVPEHVQGEDLLQSIPVDAPVEMERAVYSLWPRKQVSSLRKGRFKLIQRSGQPLPQRWELYDLDADPGETRNLRNDGADEHDRVFRELRSGLEALQDAARSYRDTLETGARVELDEHTREALRQLGYLGDNP